MSKGFLGGSVVKNTTVNAGDVGLIPGLGRSLEQEMATHSSILALEIPWTVEPGGLQSTGPQRVRHNLVTEHTHPNVEDFVLSLIFCIGNIF